MPRFIVFDDTTGIISKILEVDTADVVDNVQADENYIRSIEQVDFDVHYISNPGTTPEIEVMPYLSSVASWDTTGVDSDGVDTASLSGLPTPSTVTIKPVDPTIARLEDHDIGDGVAAFTTTVDGVFEVVAESEGYLDYIEHISAGQVVGISLLSTFVDFDAANIPTTIQVELSDVLIVSVPLIVSAVEDIPVDAASITSQLFDVVVHSVDITEVSYSNINTTMYYPVVTESSVVGLDLLSSVVGSFDVSTVQTDRVEIDTNIVSINNNDASIYPDVVYVDTSLIFTTLKDII